MTIFASRLREVRTLRGMTQAQLGAVVYGSDRQIRMYESGRQEPSVSRAAALAKALNVSLDYLAGLKDE